jgi:hypothetical protein
MAFALPEKAVRCDIDDVRYAIPFAQEASTRTQGGRFGAGFAAFGLCEPRL